MTEQEMRHGLLSRPWKITGETWEGDGTGGVLIDLPDGGSVFITRWEDRGTPDRAQPADWAAARLIVEAVNTYRECDDSATSPVFAVLREDLFQPDRVGASVRITVVKVFASPQAAEEETARLNGLNENNGCVYYVQQTRLVTNDRPS